MLKEKSYIVGNSTSECKQLLQLLGDRIIPSGVFSGRGNVEKCLEQLEVDKKSSKENLTLLFADQSHLDKMASYLEEMSDTYRVILVAFSPHKIDKLPEGVEIFDIISLSDAFFNPSFFFRRLEGEIREIKQIGLLQYEVREFYEIGKSLTSEKDTIQLFDMILSSSMRLTSSDAGSIYLVVDKKTGNCSPISQPVYEDKLLKFVKAKTMSMDVKLETETFPIVKQSISGYTVITGKSLRIDDAYSIPPDAEYRHFSTFDSNSGYRTKSILSVPMKDHEDKVMGVIQLINKKQNAQEQMKNTEDNAIDRIIAYDYTDELMMNSLAGQAAVSLENSLLYRDMQQLLQDYREQNDQLLYLSRKVLKAHEEERKRIAREIHDGPAQSASSMVLKLELCKKYMQVEDYVKAAQEMGKLGDGLRHTVKEIRTVIYDLKPSYLEDGLIKALENHIRNFSENTGIRVEFNTSGSDGKIEYYLVSTIYRMAQEALSNIYKHAEAFRAEVDLSISDAEVYLKIKDNGKGFDTKKVKPGEAKSLEGGFGLEGIRERAGLVKGTVSILSAPRKGTAVTIRIPLG